MKTLFLSAGPIEWGSARMRCYWPAKYMQDADVVVLPRQGEITVPMEYDTFIFQKYGNPDIQAELIKQGKKVYLDQCDPMWWFNDQKLMHRLFDNAHGAVFSSKALMNDFLKWWGDDYNAVTIPDRLDFDHFDRQKKHHWISPVRFIWYGVSVNRVALGAAFANLTRLRVNGYNVSLTVMDDRPDMPVTEINDIPILYTQWELDKEVAQIAAHDIALLPPYPGPWGKVKSNNKALTANACNVPHTTGEDYEELVRMMDHKYRKEYANQLLKVKGEYWDVQRSAEEWEAFIA